MPRLFVAAWPPAPVVAGLAGLDRPARPGLRWTRPDQWHVTLQFLGDVAADRLPALVEALGALRAASTLAEMGPSTRRLGRTVLMAPVRGVDSLAAEVGACLAGAAPARDPETGFLGHLTLARARDPRALAGLTGSACAATWAVDEISLVESHLGPGGARYERLTAVPLTAT